MRSFLGLEPDVPGRRLTVRPRLPAAWGRIALTDLVLGSATVHVEARGRKATTQGLPPDWELVTSDE